MQPRWPFKRCGLHWEDPWNPAPTDNHHWCSVAPGHEGKHSCICGSVRETALAEAK